jgi:hypothetical protein
VVWFFGIQTDTDPYTGLPHMSLRPPVSARTVYSAAGGICVAHNRYEPIVLDVDNGTAASVIEYVTLEYAAY